MVPISRLGFIELHSKRLSYEYVKKFVKRTELRGWGWESTARLPGWFCGLPGGTGGGRVKVKLLRL